MTGPASQAYTTFLCIPAPSSDARITTSRERGHLLAFAFTSSFCSEIAASRQVGSIILCCSVLPGMLALTLQHANEIGGDL